MGDLLAEVLVIDLAIAGLFGILSGFIHGYTGFGGALVLAPLLAILFGPVEAVALVAISTVMGSIRLFPQAMKIARWREMAPIAITVLIATPLGTALLLTIDPGLSRQIIGVVVILFAIILMFGWRYRGPRGTFAGAFVGAFSGVLGGYTSFSGPPLVMYFLSAPEPPEIQRASIVVAVAAAVVPMMLALGIGGAITGTTLLRALVVSSLYMAGAGMGERVFALLPARWFERAAQGVLVVAGASVLIF